MVFYRDWKNDKTGVGNDAKLLMKAKQVSENRKLYILGDKNSIRLNKFLSEQALKEKNVKIEEDLNPIPLEDTKQQKPQKRGFHYFKACDCYIPKTFSPSTPDAVFEIEGNDLSKKSSFHVYDQWGEEIYKAASYQNDWNGLDIYGEKLKLGTYYFTFQSEEGLEVVNGDLSIIDAEQEK